MSKKYTKKQIVEAISYWKKQLELGNCKRVSESFESLDHKYAPMTPVSMTDILESLEVFDECAKWSEATGPGSSYAKFPPEAAAKLAAAFSNSVARYDTKIFGIAKVMSKEEYAQYAEDNEVRTSYEDYIDDSIYDLQKSLSSLRGVGELFKANEVLVVDGVQYNNEPGKTVLVVPYAIY